MAVIEEAPPGSHRRLLLSRSGSPMRKSFALCEAFGLTPFRAKPPDPRGALRGAQPRGPLRREGVADTAVSGGEALRSLHCAARSAAQVSLRAAPRGEDLKEAGGRRPPASFKTSPLPRLDSLLGTVTRAGRGPPLPALRCAQRGASAATGGCARVRGGGGGRPRPFGMLLWCGHEAARRDHQPQLVCELMTRARSVMKKPWFLRGTVLLSGQGASLSPC